MKRTLTSTAASPVARASGLAQVIVPPPGCREEDLLQLTPGAATRLDGVAVRAQGDHLGREVLAVLGQVVEVVDFRGA